MALRGRVLAALAEVGVERVRAGKWLPEVRKSLTAKTLNIG